RTVFGLLLAPGAALFPEGAVHVGVPRDVGQRDARVAVGDDRLAADAGRVDLAELVGQLRRALDVSHDHLSVGVVYLRRARDVGQIHSPEGVLHRGLAGDLSPGDAAVRAGDGDVALHVGKRDGSEARRQA